jgi:hypothetical protein
VALTTGLLAALGDPRKIGRRRALLGISMFRAMHNGDSAETIAPRCETYGMAGPLNGWETSWSQLRAQA